MSSSSRAHDIRGHTPTSSGLTSFDHRPIHSPMSSSSFDRMPPPRNWSSSGSERYRNRPQRGSTPSTNPRKSTSDPFKQQFSRDEETKIQERPLRKHDVFLSFRGVDTRAGFISHLQTSLNNAGIKVFKDDNSLQRGDEISPSLLQAIEQSHIAVIVFSEKYADSRWCLDELVKIMECHRTIGNVVLPIFYRVDPSDVRHQRGEFGKAFESLSSKVLNKEGFFGMLGKAIKNVFHREESPDQLVKKWKEAFGQAAGIAGHRVLNNGNESETIKIFVKEVTQLLDKTDFKVANGNPVGVESRVQNVIQLLDFQRSKDVLLLGVWGMGGIGKTTIAKAIYNQISCNFEARSFLENIREVWEHEGGHVLQKRLLLHICKDTTTEIQSIDLGKSMLNERLCHKRVLLILDDVNEFDQLNALCGSRQWFGPGSRIIITTRDVHLLKGIRVDEIYSAQEMDESESIELFSLYAFKQERPEENFVEISRNIVKYSRGLPLALEVLGAYLFDRGVTEFESVLEKLERIPNNDVQKRLKISFDGLNDDTCKEIFLDIACFFIGMHRNDVIHILNGCGLHPEIGIEVLVERSLVTIDDRNKLRMHDLLRDMGREIIRTESPKHPEDRSRLWFSQDVLEVLSDKTGTKSVEGLSLMLQRANEKCIGTTAFKEMTKLRLLQLSGVQLDGNDRNFQNLSRNLRWLSWNGFPLKCIPTSFYQGNLVAIELENSKIKLMWEGTKLLENLKILNLSHSHYLIRTPDFSKLLKLEQLVLINCSSLSEISDTFGDHEELVLINLKDCISLQSLPRSIYKLKSLKTLILSGCSEIDKLEEDIEQMESLTTLIANDTAITRVPFAVGRLKNLGYISLCGYEGRSCDVVPAMIRSWTSPTKNPSAIAPLNDQSSMFEQLPQLSCIWVKFDSRVDLLQCKTIILNALSSTNSKGMELVCSSGSSTSFTPQFAQMGMNCQVTKTLKQNILQGKGDSFLPCLNLNSNGCSVKFKVPQVEGRILKTIVCAAYPSTPDNITPDGLIKKVLVLNYTKATFFIYKGDTLASSEDNDFQSAISCVESGNQVEIIVFFKNGFIVKNTRIYLIYDEPIYQELGFILVP